MSDESGTILLVEDDRELRNAIAQTLELAGLHVRQFANAVAALPEINPRLEGVVLTDIRMPRLDGIAFLGRIREIDAELPVIMMTGHGDVPMAVSALKGGAADFLLKPFDPDHLVAALRRSIAHRRLVLENRQFRAAVGAAQASPEVILGDSEPIRHLRATLRQIARVELDVLVEGETGTGKELAAVMLHTWSERAGKPFVVIDCAALPETVAAEELFGRVESDGRRKRQGRIAAAHTGTLLLDAVDAMSLVNQAKLLRLVEDRELLPLGADRPDTLDLRIVATVTGEVERAVAEGRLRPDLRYRLDTLRVRLPPLRERGDDLMLLFAAFAAEAAHEFGIRDFAVTPAIRDRLFRYSWPGNVRELRNFARGAVMGIYPDMTSGDGVIEPLATQVARFEKGIIQDALARNGGRSGSTITELGLPRKTFYDKVKRHGIALERNCSEQGERRR